MGRISHGFVAENFAFLAAIALVSGAQAASTVALDVPPLPRAEMREVSNSYRSNSICIWCQLATPRRIMPPMCWPMTTRITPTNTRLPAVAGEEAGIIRRGTCGGPATRLVPRMKM